MYEKQQLCYNLVLNYVKNREFVISAMIFKTQTTAAPERRSPWFILSIKAASIIRKIYFTFVRREKTIMLAAWVKTKKKFHQQIVCIMAHKERSAEQWRVF